MPRQLWLAILDRLDGMEQELPGHGSSRGEQARALLLRVERRGLWAPLLLALLESWPHTTRRHRLEGSLAGAGAVLLIGGLGLSERPPSVEGVSAERPAVAENKGPLEAWAQVGAAMMEEGRRDPQLLRELTPAWKSLWREVYQGGVGPCDTIFVLYQLSLHETAEERQSIPSAAWEVTWAETLDRCREVFSDESAPQLRGAVEALRAGSFQFERSDHRTKIAWSQYDKALSSLPEPWTLRRAVCAAPPGRADPDERRRYLCRAEREFGITPRDWATHGSDREPSSSQPDREVFLRSGSQRDTNKGHYGRSRWVCSGGSDRALC